MVGRALLSTAGLRFGQNRCRGGILSQAHSVLRDAAGVREAAPAVGLVPWLAVGVGCGVAIYFALPVEPPLWLGLVLFAGAAGVGWAVRRRGELALVAVAVASVAAGLVSGQVRVLVVATPVLAEELRAVEIVGNVVSADVRGGRTRLVLDAPEIAELPLSETPRRIRISVAGRDIIAPRPGDTVRVRATVGPPPGPPAPGAFDFGRTLYFQGIGGTGFALGAPLVIAEGQGRLWRLVVARVRTGVTERVLAVLPGDTGGVAVALLSGERGRIDAAAVDNMRAAGLAHLLAISGLHMGLIAGLVMVAVRGGLVRVPGLALRAPIKKWAAIAALIASFGYLLLAGAPVPTQRAFLMSLLVLLAVVVDRSAISMRLVGLAALVILLLRPESLVGASFQLSFAAVVALVAAYEILTPRLRALYAGGGVVRRFGLYFAGVALTTLVASIATLPLALQAFNTVALYGIAANLVAVPVTALWVMPWGLTALVLMPVGWEALALVPMGWGIDVVLRVAAVVAAWPGATMTVGSLPSVGFLAIVGGGLGLCLGRSRWRLAGVGLIVAGLASAPLAAAPDLLVTDRLVAVKGDGELLVSDGRRGAFVRGVWLRRAGLTDWRRYGAVEAGDGWRLGCGGGGCVYTAEGTSVAVVRDQQGLAEDCRRAALIIDMSGGNGVCGNGTRILDMAALGAGGAHAVWLEADGLRVAAANAARQRRPWGGAVRNSGGR